VPGFLNPHDDLDPEESVEIILRHVKEGLEIARKNRLPRRIHDFIAEHHGTMIARYQYVRAVTLAGGDESQVMAERFTYPGPRPRSRETAVLMLADGCEARVRAERPKDESELNNLVKGVIDNRLALGQLSDTPLTLQELEIILQSFTATLRGIYHPRVKYPRLEATVASSGEVPTVPVTFPFTAPQPSDAQVGSPGEPESSIP
jgi:membrane-associated HD superfamily phosphohydrolase